MKKIFVLLLFAALGCTEKSFAQGYHITLHVNGYRDTDVYLGNYFGKQTYLADTARLNGNGTTVFQGKEKLPGGIYFVLLPDKQKYFEILIDRQQDFEISADTSDLMHKISFHHSEDNELFYRYNRFLAGRQQEINAAKEKGEDSVKIKSLEKETGEQVQQYRKDYVRDHPQTMLAMIFRLMEEPVIPPIPKDSHVKEDSTFAYRYYKTHFWDHVNFSDERMLRTPILEARLSKYFSQLVYPVPDSVNMEADRLIARAKANKEVFKFVLWWLTHTYEASPYMGMDAVFVHLVEKYYIPGDAWWLTKDQLDKIIKRAYEIAPNLIGQKAPDLALKDAGMEPVSLYGTRARYTLLVFWDPTCGHCQKEIPVLDSLYEKNWKSRNVKIFGVRTGGTKDEWLKFIKDHHLEDWINTWDPDEQSNYHRLYDVYSTPLIYVLDENKKILAKRLDPEQVNGFLERRIKQKK